MASNTTSTDDNLTVIGAINSQIQNLSVVGKQYIITDKVDVVDEIQKETASKIDTWTKGTVEPASLEKILDKIQAGPICVITGSPGEGKTTLGYWALKHLQETRHVFKVRSPKEFDEVMKTCAPIILVDDIFGQTIFNEAAWGQWKESIEQFINMNEDKPTNKIGNLILIARDFVLKSGSRHTENPWEMLIDQNNTVNISSEAVRENEDKSKIVNAIANKYHVHLGSDTIKTICSIDPPHGFPHTCKLFVTLYKKDSSISATDFFNKPLEFLKNSLKLLRRNKVIEHIFMEMIKGNGHVVESDLSKSGSEYIETANDLCPTYVKLDEDCYVFDHPSIMDTVAFLLCETKVSFVLDNCSMEFIRERVWLQTPDGWKREETYYGAKLMADIPWSKAKELARRFMKQIKAGDVDDVWWHNAWFSVMFTTMMLQDMSDDQLKVRERLGFTLLHALCGYNHTDCVKMCVHKGVDVNLQSSDGWTPLHVAGLSGGTKSVLVLLEFDADVNKTDKKGRTALDLATHRGHSETASVLRAAGGRSTQK